MAVLSSIICDICGCRTDVSHSPANSAPKVCHACTNLAEVNKREAHLVTLAALPIEERLRRIEEWIYDYKPPKSIHDYRF